MKNKMIVLCISVLLVFGLTGCKIIEPILPKPENEFMLKVEDKTIVNTSVYLMDGSSLPIYHYLEDDTVSYVDIEEVVDFLGGGLFNYNVFKDEHLLLDFRQTVPEEYVDLIGEDYLIYEIEFNHEENTIYTSNMDLLTRLNLIYSISTSDDVVLTSIENNTVDESIEIDLDDYNFDIVEENNHYYLPLYIANLFLAGASVNLYESGDNIILFDYSADPSIINEYYTDPDYSLSDVLEQTNDYLALYFDYFYGLKEEKEIDSFYTYLEQFNLDEQSTMIDHSEAISSFLFSLDDLHTKVVDPGYMNSNYIFLEQYGQYTKIDYYSEGYIGSACHLYPDELTYTKLDDNTHLFQIPGFEFETGTQFSEYIDQINPNDDVIIDVACNSGGSLQGVIELLTYMTDEPVPIRHINSKTGNVVQEYYKSDTVDALDANFFVITSQVTYSAANVFATIVNDMELGFIFGAPTLGGSCAIVYTVLPNGMLISNSSYMTFIDESLEINDDGISVDLSYRMPYDKETLADEIDSYFVIGSEYLVFPTNLFGSERISFTLYEQDERINVSYYTLEVMDSSNEIVFTEQYTEDFVERLSLTGSWQDYEIRLTAKYTYNSTVYEELIYYKEIE